MALENSVYVHMMYIEINIHVFDLDLQNIWVVRHFFLHIEDVMALYTVFCRINMPA